MIKSAQKQQRFSGGVSFCTVFIRVSRDFKKFPIDSANGWMNPTVGAIVLDLFKESKAFASYNFIIVCRPDCFFL
jgi:hypothetical protein